MSGRPPPLITVYSNSDTVAQKQTHTHKRAKKYIYINNVAGFKIGIPTLPLPAARHVDSEAKCQGKIFNSTCAHTHMHTGALENPTQTRHPTLIVCGV